MVCLTFPVFVGTLNVTRADNQSSDSNGDPNTWSMFHSDLTHSGVSASNGPTTNQTLWTFKAANEIISSPAVCGGVVYFGSNGYGLSDNTIYAVNSTTGVQIWNFTTGGQIDWSSPAIAGGLVYMGSEDGHLYALNVLTGVQAWNYSLNANAYIDSPAVSNGIVYFGASMGFGLFAVNATTGAYLWNYTLTASTGVGDVQSCPAISGGTVYVGTTLPDDSMVALSASSNHVNWQVNIMNQVDSSPAVYNGEVYVGAPDSSGHTYLDAFNAGTGNLDWQFKTSAWVESSPAVYNGVIYVNCDDGNVSAISIATHSLVWSYKMGGFAEKSSSPAIANGVVYVGSNDHNVYAFNLTTGTLIWKYLTGYSVVSSPAVAGGKVYVGSLDDYMYCFGQPPLAAPSVAPSSGVIDQGQTSVLTSTAVTTGNSPYTCMWFSKGPGASAYSLISGASLSSFNFATTAYTTPGTWNFILQVTDITPTAVNCTAASVTVNPALAAPTVTPSSNTLNQGDTATLTSTTVTTGTSPYSYQWLSEAPGTSSYSLVAATSSSYNFTTPSSTATGTWNFILQTTDNAGAAVNSTAVSVVVNPLTLPESPQLLIVFSVALALVTIVATFATKKINGDTVQRKQAFSE